MLALLFGALSHDGETDRPIPLWGAVTIGAAVGFASGLPAWVVVPFSRLCSSRYTGRLRDKQQPFQHPLYWQIRS